MSDGNQNTHPMQRTTLDALVRKKFNIGHAHPVLVTQVLGTHTYAKVMPPILRCIQSEHSDILVESPLLIHTEGLTEEMGIMAQFINEQWRLSEILSAEEYAKREHEHIKKQLLLESDVIASPLTRRAAKRKFEQWFGLSSQEGNPWALPGLMNQGSPIISKKILKWCSKKGGAAIEQAIRSGTPKAEEWGAGSFQCAVMALDEVQPKFVSVVIEQSTYENLMNQWRLVLEKPSKSSSLPALTLPVPQKSARFDGSSGVSIQKNSPSAPAPTQHETIILPHRLQALLELHHLPRPTPPFSNSLKTLISWTEASIESFRTRCTDFLLMMLAEGDNVRPNPDLADIWVQWHRTSDPIAQLLTLVKQQEEAIAIQALFGPHTPKADFARALTNDLLVRWKNTLKKGNPDPTPQTDTSLRKIRKVTRTRGLRAADIWVDRLFLSLVSASLNQTPVLLGSTRQLAHQLMEQVIKPCFAHADYEALRLSRRKSHIFGKISRERDIFALSDLSKAFRQAAHAHRNRTTDIWSPYFIMIEDVSGQGKTADIAQLYQKSYSQNGVMLFSQEENTRWYKEYTTLHARNDLNREEVDRRDLLEEFFSPERLGAVHPEESWRLHAPPNVLLLGVLDTNHAPKQLELLSHSYVVCIPDINIQSLPVSSQLLPKLQTLAFTPPKTEHVDAWEDFPKCRMQLFSMMRTLGPCNFNLTPQLSEQVSVFLAIASLWGIPDGPIATSHLFQTLFLPRIRCKGSTAIKPIETLLKRDDLAPDLLKRLSVLRSRAIQHGSEWFHGAIR